MSLIITALLCVSAGTALANGQPECISAVKNATDSSCSCDSVHNLEDKIQHAFALLNHLASQLNVSLPGTNNGTGDAEVDVGRSQVSNYTFHTWEKSWARARNHCKSQGGDLVSIDSVEELQDINSRVTEYIRRSDDQFWTSGKARPLNSNHYYWGNGSQEISLDAGIWGNGEPNNWEGVEESCLSLNREPTVYGDTQFWLNDSPCHQELKYICEYLQNTL